MRKRVRTSINRKLAGMVLTAVGTALIVIASAALYQEIIRYADSKRESLVAAAHAFSAASAPALAQKSPGRALEAIRGIGRVPGLLHAGLYDLNGFAFAELGSAIRLEGDLDLTDEGRTASPFDILKTPSISVSVQVIDSGVPIGRLTLVTDTQDLFGRLKGVLMTAALGAALAAAIGLAIAIRLQRSITAPLVKLAQTMDKVELDHDFAARLDIVSDDEIGTLVDSFNAMLGEIRERDLRLAGHRAKLEQEVAERTQDYRVARDAAESANAAKSDFLATMSHEIRTPMNGMLVMAELLAAAGLPQPQRRYADVIARSGQSLLAIINDILDVSKVEAGKLELESVEVSPVTVIETVTTLFTERAKSKGLDLACIVTPGTPAAIMGDPVRLNQVVSNLVNNALKFTEKGFVSITLAPMADRPGHLAIAVTDTGIGIPADKLGSIFDAFSQADQSTTRRYGGTGLGLAICRKLVDAMDGEIDVRSEPGQGSVFTLIIPTGIAANEAVPPAPAVRTDPVDMVCIDIDGAATRAALGGELERWGYRLVAPNSPEAAHAHWIVDADALMDRERRPNLAPGRVIAVTSLGETAGGHAVGAGLADAVLRRPVLTGEWNAIVMKLATGIASLDEAAPVKAAARRTLPHFPHARVLVADDSAVNREVACEALSMMGIKAATVETGRAACEAVENGGFDLILMDGSMPDLDGFEATRLIRANEAAKGRAPMPILAMTAHVIGAGANAWRDAGMNGVLRKPFTVNQMADCLIEWLAPSAKASPEPEEAAASASLPVTVSDLPPAPASAHPPASALTSPEQMEDASDEPLLDPAQLADLAAMSGGNAAFLARVLGLYLEHAPPALATLQASLTGTDSQAIAAAAHALKSMSVNIGARRAAARFGQIEAAARAGEPVSETELRETTTLLDATCQAIRTEHSRVVAQVEAAA